MKAKTNLFAVGMFLTVLARGFGQPIITRQPQSQTNVIGSTSTLAVEATGTQPLSYQWRKSSGAVAGATNATLIFTNLQPSHAENYTVVITNIEGAVTSAVAFVRVLVPPSITAQPTNFLTLSLGASVSNRVTAAGTVPLVYEWQLNGTNLSGQTNALVVLTNLQWAHVGEYTVLVTNLAGSVTSQVARLNVDGTFTKMTTGPLATELAFSRGAAWEDYDRDGFVDLFVARALGNNNGLFRNNGAGAFSKIATGNIPNDGGDSTGCAWGDYDNDGYPDLFVANASGQNDFLYRNNGDGTFTRVTTGAPVTDGSDTWGCAWGDYDNDGFLDLFVANPGQHNFLYRNNANGTFTRITTGSIVSDIGSSVGCAWGDYDNDGFLDLFVANTELENNFLYRNNRNGTFTRVTTGSMVNDGGYSTACAWGDYDNDGWLDLFVGNGAFVTNQNNFLYRNNGDGTFTKITTGSIVNDGGFTEGAAWGDYDNDGFLDLFVSNHTGQNNFLYHNNGDGTFTKITNGSPVNDGGYSTGCAWGDFNNDGFLDLFVSNGGRFLAQAGFLYLNNGNSNSWISLKLVGTVSNRSAIGAKVRLKATMGGVSRWQLRGGGGDSGWNSQNSHVLAFGLGDATNVDLIRIEWPSGLVQEWRDVAVKQWLTVTEPPRMHSPRLTNGVFAFTLRGSRGLQYGIQRSTNALNWVPAGTVTVTNFNGTSEFAEPVNTKASQHLYRAVSP